MNYADAARFVMPFGKHKGRTLDSIACTDDGLVYLDWLLGDLTRGNQTLIGDRFRLANALRIYLAEPAIQKDLARILAEK